MRLILDVDGVIVRGEEALPDAGAFFALLHRRGIPYVLLTNNSTRTPGAVSEKLSGMGIEVPAEAVLTSAQVTATHVARTFPGAPVYVVGEDGLRRALADSGSLLIGDEEALGSPPPNAVVVVGLDTALTYRALACATALLQQGAPFIATNRDPSFPQAAGRIAPGSGALVAALEVTTGRTATVMGKPELPVFEDALARLDQMAGPRGHGETWMVGDRLDTDILGAQRAGLPAALVLTGVTGAGEAARAQIQPDLVVETLSDLSSRLLGMEVGDEV